MNDLSKKDNWINPSISYTFNRNITEYDMREAGFSLVREYSLLPKKTIKDLESLNKEDRHVKIGKMQRDVEGFSKALQEAFAETRRLFFELNHIKEEDIISIKKDAIFLTKRCKFQTIGDYVIFRPKNTYTSYIHLDKMLEIYYGPGHTDVKGLGKKNTEKHTDYMTSMISTFCLKMEEERPRNVLRYLRRFCDHYKKRELELGYYRTFNSRSEFIMIDDPEVFYDQITIEDLENIDISYNFFNVIIKLMKIPI